MTSNKPIFVADVPPKYEVISLDSDEDDNQTDEHGPNSNTTGVSQNDIETLWGSEDELNEDSLSPILDRESDGDESCHDPEIDEYMRAAIPLRIGWKDLSESTSNFNINDISNIIITRKHTEELTESSTPPDHSISKAVVPTETFTQVSKKKTARSVKEISKIPDGSTLSKERAIKKINNKSDNNETDTASTSVTFTQVYSKDETDVIRPKKKSKTTVSQESKSEIVDTSIKKSTKRRRTSKDDSVSNLSVVSSRSTDDTKVEKPKKKSKRDTPVHDDANDTSSSSVSSTQVYSTGNTQIEKPRKKRKSRRDSSNLHDENETVALGDNDVEKSTKEDESNYVEGSNDTMSTSTIAITPDSDLEEIETTKPKRKTKPKITPEGDYSAEDLVEFKNREKEIIALSEQEHKEAEKANALKLKLKVHTDKLKVIRNQRKAVEKIKRERNVFFNKHAVARKYAMVRDNPGLADERYSITCPGCKQVVAVELGVIHSGCGKEHDLDWVREQYTLLQCTPDRKGLEKNTHKCDTYVCCDVEQQLQFDENMKNGHKAGWSYYTFSNKTHLRVNNALNNQPKEIEQPEVETQVSGENAA